MEERLVLVRRDRYNAVGSHPKVSVTRETYDTLKEMSRQTGLNITALLLEIVRYAADKVTLKEER